MKPGTTFVHGGQEPDEATGAVTVPVFQSSTFRQQGIGIHGGFEYSRTGNPTRSALEKALAFAEGAEYSLAFSSGVAATAAVFGLLKSGDRVLCGDDVYGGTYRLLERVFKRWGVEAGYADADEADSFGREMTKNTKLIWIETPTNPLLKIIDIRKTSEIARENGALLAVDNTFASPFLQNPLDHGADIVVHSTTKYIAGHSDIVGGAAAVNDRELYDGLRNIQNSAGAVPGPWDCWLALRGLRTLHLRMKAHEENAASLAEYLSGRGEVERVYYPGLYTGSARSVLERQMRGSGGMLSFELKGGRPAVEKFFAGLKIFTLAESLGGVESLISYPAGMTHASIPGDVRLKLGITESLVRVSAGVEDKDDLRKAFESALNGLKG